MFRAQTETTSMLWRAVYSVFSWTQGIRPFKDIPTKRPSSKGPVAKGPVAKGPATKGPGYERSGCTWSKYK
jgi:hypothetical protein